ncbi:MAG TPA: DUF4038 domain-containing protein, partial [Magnetospirillum sp.]|nr:DUF4038 domain-containing protein [Magnetospirillum sp.]
AYQALLSGAAGQVFGNNPVWHFHGSGVEAAALTWRQALDSSGAHGMTHLRSLFDRLPWWRLQPDRKGALVIRGAGVGQDRVAAALSPDGALAVLYVPMQRPVTLDLSQLAGPRVMSTWFDPSGGRFAPVAGAPYRTERPMRFQPSGSTSDGHGDWVLVLVSQP